MNIDGLRDALTSRKILKAGSLQQVDIEQVLEGRDEKEFEDAWLAAFDALKSLTLSNDKQRQVDEIREAAFKAVYDATGSDELAGYVSDDFDVIARAALNDEDQCFAGAMLDDYLRALIPGGKRVPTSSSLADGLKKLQSP
ncbi:MAG: hypothetical protein M5U25_10075 [Planctomycetota bacterium]|nr:hypothetical protein [Planctomycetota bacterium]